MDGVQRIHVERESLWSDSIATFKDPKFNLLASPRVKFFEEPGIDAGGLRREYATLLRQQIFSCNANLFEGLEKRKLPVYSVEALQAQLFFVIRKMIAYLIVHLDIGIPCLSHALYKYITSGSIEMSSALCELDDLADLDIQEWIHEVHLHQKT